MNSPKQTITKDEFIRRFVDHMIKAHGETDADGNSVREYAAEAAPLYYDDALVTGDTPEECAEGDMDCWEIA